MKNLLADLPDSVSDERIETLLAGKNVRVERIVSRGHTSPPGFWYDQSEREWVLLLSGAAALRFEDSDESLNLRPGDCIDIAPHRRHRVEWTVPDEPTVWLAVFYEVDDSETNAD